MLFCANQKMATSLRCVFSRSVKRYLNWSTETAINFINWVLYHLNKLLFISQSFNDFQFRIFIYCVCVCVCGVGLFKCFGLLGRFWIPRKTIETKNKAKRNNRFTNVQCSLFWQMTQNLMWNQSLIFFFFGPVNK